MATNGAMEKLFQERIARAQEAARLASIAAMARSSAPRGAPPPPPPPPPAPLGVLRGPPPPRSLAAPPRPPPAASPPAAAIPDDVRHRIDRLVEFIARNGAAFEEAARERERDNPDFAFLRAGAPFHDYFVWKKTQAVRPSVVHAPPPRPLVVAAAESELHVSVGAMADACKAARARGLPPYTPLPSDALTASAPPVEPARLEARLAEFYRSTWSS